LQFPSSSSFAAGGDEEIFWTGSIAHDPNWLTLDPRLSTAGDLVTHSNIGVLGTRIESIGIAIQKLAATRQVQPRASKTDELTAEEQERLEQLARDYAEQIKQAVTAQAQDEDAKKPSVRLTTTSGAKMTKQAGALKTRLIDLAPVDETDDGSKDGGELTTKGVQRHLDALSEEALCVFFKNAVLEHIPSARTAKTSRTEPASKAQPTAEDAAHMEALDNFEGVLHDQYRLFCTNILKHIQANPSTKSHAAKFKASLTKELKVDADEGGGEGDVEGEEGHVPEIHPVVDRVRQLSDAGLVAFWAKCVDKIGPKVASELKASSSKAWSAAPKTTTTTASASGSSKSSLPIALLTLSSRIW
jgi:hypothetical protein